MKKKFLFLILGFSVIFGITFFACEEPSINPDSETAKQNARAEGSIIDVFGFVSSNADGGGKAINEECYTLDFNHDVTTGIRTLSITFDEAGCTINDVVFKGEIEAEIINGSWFEVGSQMTITFENFERDGYGLSGTIVALYERNEGENITELVPVQTITTTDMVQTYPDGKTFAWSGTREIKWLSGFFTKLNRSDDKIEINANITGTNLAGEAFTSVSESLIKNPDCDQFVSGTVTITKGTDIITINFGNGECDGEFSVTQGGVSINI